MTVPLFRLAPYDRTAPARIAQVTDEGGIVLDQSLFYPTGGGQPGDSGTLVWDGGEIAIATAVKGDAGRIILIPAEPQALPPVGAGVVQHLDWDRRHRHMRVHTALHLLSVIIPLPVSGGAIGDGRGRLDFDMPDPPDDPDALSAALNALIARDLRVSDEYVAESVLDANPALVKTMSVAPPRGTGEIRLVRITDADGTLIDLQPCGGTHVVRSAEIGPVALGRFEKKGRQNRRVPLWLL
jgi:misacylated tRNA(Ala) deacylase